LDRQTAVSTATVPADPYDRDHTCWRCKERGHIRFNRKRSARMFCSQCGKDDVLTCDCHPRPEKGTAAEDAPAATRPSAEFL